MSTTAVNNVLANFAKANQRLKDARANTGSGQLGWWPQEGEYTVGVANIEVSEGKFEFKMQKTDQNYKSRPAMKVQVRLQLTDDPGSPDAPRAFNDREFVIPYDVTGLPSNKGADYASMARIAEERLKGFICTCLGIAEESLDDAAAALQSLIARVQEKLAASTFLTVKVLARYKEDNRRKNADGTAKFNPDACFYQELINP